MMNLRPFDDADLLPHYTLTPERAQFLADTVTTAIAGGVTYWANVLAYHWWDPDMDGTAVHAPGLANAYALIVDKAKPRHLHLVMVDDIDRALGVCREGPVEGLSEDLRADIVANDSTNGNPTDGHQDIDAGLADCLVQIALFGQVNHSG